MFCSMARAMASALAVVVGFSSAASALDAPTKAAIAKLLEVGWSPAPPARVAADVQYDEVQRVAAGDKSALTASLLVLMQQRRYDDALKRADALIAKDETDLTALRAKVWISTLLKNYQAAMLTADQLSKQLEAKPATNEAEQAVHDELFGFLGRIYGYLGAPVAEAVNQDERKRTEKEILARIVETRRALFEEARDGVVGKFLEMTGAKDDARAAAIAKAEADKDKTLREIDAERETITERAKELEDRRNKLQSELKDELAEIAKKDRPLVQELARLDSQATSINRDLFAYDAEIGRLRARAETEENDTIRLQLLREADRLAFIARRVQSDLIAVNRLIDGVQAERAGLAARQQKAQATTAEQTRRIDQELTGLVKRDKRNDAIEKRASRPATGVTSKGRALAAQAAALSTYDQFPLEAAKASLLESLR
jgi:hypothetical protein